LEVELNEEMMSRIIAHERFAAYGWIDVRCLAQLKTEGMQTRYDPLG